MKYPENIQEIATLKPDYFGFIFWDKSSRKFDGAKIPELEPNCKKVGVFVDASIDEIQTKMETFLLHFVQLHGEETVNFCKEVKQLKVKVIKAFSIDDAFNFQPLEAYENAVDYFLFDTKGKLPGGNGTTFNWQVLENYSMQKPFFLSGGIGLTEIPKIQEFLASNLSKYCYAIDVNSQFEIEPGLKNKIDLNTFKKLLYENKI